MLRRVFQLIALKRLYDMFRSRRGGGGRH